MGEADIKSPQGNQLEALGKTKSLDERAAKSRQFLATNNFDINKVAADLSLAKISDTADSREYVGQVIKIQAKLGFKQTDSGSGQDGIFGKKTLEAYRNSIEKSDLDEARIARNAEKLRGRFSPAEMASREQDQIELLRLEEELAAAEDEFNNPKTPAQAPGPQPPPAAPQAESPSPGLAESQSNPEIAPLGVELKHQSDICIIGDSNATKMAERIPGTRVVGKEGETSENILKMLIENQQILNGVKLVLIRVGGNDGGKWDKSKLTPEQTLENIDKIVEICRTMKIPEVRILTRQPQLAGSSSKSKTFTQREDILRKYGEGRATEKEGTRVAVIDLYKHFAGNQPIDKNTSLPQKYGAKDGIHMNWPGYIQALKIIAQATGAPQITQWTGKKA